MPLGRARRTTRACGGRRRCEALAALPPAFTRDGTITAGNASQVSDGAAAAVDHDARRRARRGLEPLAEVVGRAVVAGPDSTLHLRPAEAAREAARAPRPERRATSTCGRSTRRSPASCWPPPRRSGIDLERVNVNGGAVALGHPLAGSGLRLVLTLAYELRRRGGGLGVATLCGGGGQGEAILLRVARSPWTSWSSARARTGSRPPRRRARAGCARACSAGRWASGASTCPPGCFCAPGRTGTWTRAAS